MENVETLIYPLDRWELALQTAKETCHHTYILTPANGNVTIVGTDAKYRPIFKAIVCDAEYMNATHQERGC